MVKAWDERGSWGRSVWNLLVWDVVCGITGGQEQGLRGVGAEVEWSPFSGPESRVLV